MHDHEPKLDWGGFKGEPKEPPNDWGCPMFTDSQQTQALEAWLGFDKSQQLIGNNNRFAACVNFKLAFKKPPSIRAALKGLLAKKI